MIIGFREQFAFEYETVPSVGSVVLGHFCMWANGEVIGNFRDISVLTAIQAQVERSLQYSGRRQDPLIYSIGKCEAFRHLRAILYGDDGDSDVERSLRYGGFNLTEVGISSFDGIYVFLIDGNGGQRLLWGDIRGTYVHEAFCPPKAYEAVATEWLRTIKRVGEIS